MFQNRGEEIVNVKRSWSPWPVLLVLFLAACHSQINILPTAEPPPSTGSADLIIGAFTASPNLVERGSSVTLSWDVPGAAQIAIWPMVFDLKTGRWVPREWDGGLLFGTCGHRPDDGDGAS
jgi:hypothetical protein